MHRVREYFTLILLLSFNHLALAQETLIDTQQLREISKSRSWHTLMHYHPTTFGNLESSIDSPHFFLSLRGKIDSLSELESNLIALREDDSYICKLPARYEYLCKIHETTCEDPINKCLPLAHFAKPHLHSNLSLIFASAFLKNPASMFGHTFLRLDRKERIEPSPLLETSINFAARTDSEKGVIFAFKGLTGGFRGTYGIQSFTKYVEEYTENENRDLWEYQLNLRTSEIRRLLLHLWELRNVYFDYYFLDENCSSQLLTLIESARPTLTLSKHSKIFTLPTDTIRSVLRAKHLVSDTTYRPSRTSILRMQQSSMNIEDIKTAKALSTGKKTAHALSSSISRERRIQILDLAIDGMDKGKNDELLNPILLERSKLGVKKAISYKQQNNKDPSRGHPPHRSNLKVGAQQNRFFIEPEIRFLYHDDTDPTHGFLPGSSLEVLKTSLRYYPNEDSFYFEKIQAIKISSSPLRDTFIKPFSWEVSLQGERRVFENQKRALLTSGRAMGGAHYMLTNRLSLNTMIGSELVASGRFRHKFNLAPITKADFILHLTPPLHMKSTAIGKTYLLESSVKTSYSIATSIAVDISKEFQIQLEYERAQEFADPFNHYRIGLKRYF